MRKDASLEHMRNELKIKNENYGEPLLKSMMLDTTKEIYKGLNLGEMKVVNFNNGGNGGEAGSSSG